MSFGHSVSRKQRSAPVHYRFGEKDRTPKHWYSKRVGWFGYAILISIVSLFGLFSVEAREQFLQVASMQLNSLNPADFRPVNDNKPKQLSMDSLGSATNIVEVQPLLATWAKSHGQMQWGLVVKSIDGPQMDAGIQTSAQFETRALYKIFLAAALYDQIPYEKQWTTIKANGRSVTITLCMEKMLTQDDRDCTDALGKRLDQKAAAAFFKKNDMKRTDLIVNTRVAKTTASDTQELFSGINGSLLDSKLQKQLLKFMNNQPKSQVLAVSCPGCTTIGSADYGIGRLEAAGIVKYSKGSYVFVMLASGGTKDMVGALSGQLQQRIVEVTTGAFKP